jgi:hypothetical protein
VCITGLQRSYPEFAKNIHAGLSSLYAPLALADGVDFFGVRPASDSWSAVRVHLPPLTNESVQAPCGYNYPAWFTAYSRSRTQLQGYRFAFVQSLCDMAACMGLIEHHEAHARAGAPFDTLARMRLDLAWEAPPRMPPDGLRPQTVHLPRMNAKAGVNDK